MYHCVFGANMALAADKWSTPPSTTVLRHGGWRNIPLAYLYSVRGGTHCTLFQFTEAKPDRDATHAVKTSL